jgi:hypothetical protein
VKACNHCQQPLPAKWRPRYCNTDCRKAARTLRRRETAPRIAAEIAAQRALKLSPCTHCGVPFAANAKPGRPRKYHDEQCKRLAAAQRPRARPPTKPLRRVVPLAYQDPFNRLLQRILDETRIHHTRRLAREYALPLRIVTMGLRADPRIAWSGPYTVRHKIPEPNP